jgi:hypothetical protein
MKGYTYHLRQKETRAAGVAALDAAAQDGTETVAIRRQREHELAA